VSEANSLNSFLFSLISFTLLPFPLLFFAANFLELFAAQEKKYGRAKVLVPLRFSIQFRFLSIYQ